jgi:hypothetical protein
MSKAANMTTLEVLHALVAEALTEGVRERDPKILAEAIKFLKGNGVEPARDVDNSALNALRDQVNAITADLAPDEIADRLN